MFEGEPDGLGRRKSNPPSIGLIKIVGGRGGSGAGLRRPRREHLLGEPAHGELRAESKPDRGVHGIENRPEGQEFAGIYAPFEIRGPRRGNPVQDVLHCNPAAGGAGMKLKRFPAKIGEPDMAEVPVPVSRAKPVERLALGKFQPAGDRLGFADGVEQAPGELPALDEGVRPVPLPLDPAFPLPFAGPFPAALVFPLPPKDAGRLNRLRTGRNVHPPPKEGVPGAPHN